MGIYLFSEVLKKNPAVAGPDPGNVMRGNLFPPDNLPDRKWPAEATEKTSRQLMERMGKEGSRIYAIVPMGDPKTSKAIHQYEDAMRAERYKAAQKIFATYTQEQVDKIFLACATAANKARISLAKLAVEETGMGVVEDKVIKNHYAAEYIYNTYKKRENVRSYRRGRRLRN